MPVSAATLRKLIDAGLSGDELVEIVAAIDADHQPQAKVRSAHALRQERYRERKASQSVTSDASRDVTEPTKEIPPKPPKENITPSTPTGSSPKTPRAELELILDPAHAAAVLDHRQKLRKPLTGHAASLLAKRLSEFPDPNAAADEMIERGWQSIKPGWGQGQARAGPGRRSTASGWLEDLANGLGAANGQGRTGTAGKSDLDPVGSIPGDARRIG